tara:strand:- start:19 stop:423 length:405 start_codon:yes stop_codon:yes gene_type:complete
MTFKINILTHAFNQFSATESLRTDLLNSFLRDKEVDYCAVASRDGADVTRKFLVHNVESSWLAKSNGEAVISADVVEVEGGENRQITMRVNRIDTINGEETPKVTIALNGMYSYEPAGMVAFLEEGLKLESVSD